jgi:hypothetical protein
MSDHRAFPRNRQRHNVTPIAPLRDRLDERFVFFLAQATRGLATLLHTRPNQR